MNIEELKLTLEAINSVAGNAQTIAIWWFVLDFLKPAVILVPVLAVVLYGMRLLVSLNDWAEAGKRVSRAYGGEAGAYFYKADLRAIDKAIAAAKETK